MRCIHPLCICTSCPFLTFLSQVIFWPSTLIRPLRKALCTALKGIPSKFATIHLSKRCESSETKKDWKKERSENDKKISISNNSYSKGNIFYCKSKNESIKKCFLAAIANEQNLKRALSKNFVKDIGVSFFGTDHLFSDQIRLQVRETFDLKNQNKI